MTMRGAVVRSYTFGIFAGIAGALAACGGSGGEGAPAKSGSIPSMPASPGQAAAKEGTPPAKAVPTPKEICAGAPKIEVKLTLAHVEDVPPAKHGAPWDKTLEKEAIGYATALTADKGSGKPARLAPTPTLGASFSGIFGDGALVRRFPQLAQSKEFMAKRDDAGKLAAELCLNDAWQADCLGMMRSFMKAPNTSPEVAFAFGKTVRRHQNHSIAVPFFESALRQKKDAAWCSDEDLTLAVVAGLGLPPDFEGAPGARYIAAAPCYDALRETVRTHLAENPTGYYRDNACAVLEATGDL